MAITAPGDTNPSDATGVGYRTLKKCPLFHLSTYGNPRGRREAIQTMRPFIAYTQNNNLL